METVSHHLLRRTARAKKRKLNARYVLKHGNLTAEGPYRVEKALRGPYRYRVVR